MVLRIFPVLVYAVPDAQPRCLVYLLDKYLENDLDVSTYVLKHHSLILFDMIVFQLV